MIGFGKPLALHVNSIDRLSPMDTFSGSFSNTGGSAMISYMHVMKKLA
jgi:hypothetical protein